MANSDTTMSNGPNPSNGNSTDVAVTNGAPESTVAPGLSADEMALYDRQIRLWGAKAQEQIRKAKVLLVSLRAVGTEIAKNLTLAGIQELTIIDNEEVTEDDIFGAQFFLRKEDVGKPRAEAAAPRIQELNPRVAVKSGGNLQDLLMKATTDPTYWTQFNCVIACDHDIMTLSSINIAARVALRPFYAAGIHGFYGYIFADLIAHEFVVEREKPNRETAIAAETLTRSVVSVTTRKENNGKTTEIVKKAEMYCPLLLANTAPLPVEITSNRRKLKTVPPLLPCLRALFDFQRESNRLPDVNKEDITRFTELVKQKTAELALPLDTLNGEFLKSFIQNIGAEINPTAAFVGGRLSEDVINVLGNREQPIQNFALFDGESVEGRILSLFSAPPELQPPGLAVYNAPLGNDVPLSNGALGTTHFGGNGTMDLSGSQQQNGLDPAPRLPDADPATANVGTIGNDNAESGPSGTAPSY